MLYSKDRKCSFFITKNFENCYIGDANHPELGKKIFLLYRYQMSVEFVKFERAIELISDYSTDYDYGSEKLVMYVFNIPKEHEQDFTLFLQGKYTKFSELLKSKILDFWNIKNPEDAFYGIIYANGSVKKDTTELTDIAEEEYWPKPVLTREIYMNPN